MIFLSTFVGNFVKKEKRKIYIKNITIIFLSTFVYDFTVKSLHQFSICPTSRHDFEAIGAALTDFVCARLDQSHFTSQPDAVAKSNQPIKNSDQVTKP